MIRLMFSLFLRSFCLLTLASTVQARDLTLKTAQVGQHDTDVLDIAHQLERISQSRDIDIWLLYDIEPHWSDEIANAIAIGSNSKIDFFPRNGGLDNRFLIVFKSEELRVKNLGKPLLNQYSAGDDLALVEFCDTRSRIQFSTLLIHGSAHEYPSPYLESDLNDWARHAKHPLIAVGQFNVDRTSGSELEATTSLQRIPFDTDKSAAVLQQTGMMLSSTEAGRWLVDAEIIRSPDSSALVDNEAPFVGKQITPLVATFRLQ